MQTNHTSLSLDFAGRRAATMIAALTLALVPACGPSVPNCCAETSEGGVSSLPTESIWNLDSTWQDQRGASVTLASLAGRPAIVTLIFTHCTYACPRIVADLQQLSQQLGATRERVRFVLCSMDPARDTPARLAQFATERGLGPEFLLLTSPESNVRELSAALDLPYKALDNGDFAHSNGYVVVDAHGRLLTRVRTLGADSEPAQRALHEALKH